MNKYKISVIIPVYKTEKLIRRCLESLKKQSIDDYEVIIVNDCTPDGAMCVVNEYAKCDSRYKLVEHEENQGLMCARRSGYKASSGKYYMFLDSDDTLPDNALQTLFDAIESSDADIVVAGFRKIWEATNKVEEYPPKVLGDFSPVETFNLLLSGKMTHNLAFAIFNADLFKCEYLTIPNQTNGEDLILFYQLVANAHKIKTIPFIAYNYFQDGVSSTRSLIDENRLIQYAIVHNFKLKFLTSFGISEKAIMRNIIYKVSEWYNHKYANKAVVILDNRIKENMRFPYVFKYLTISQTLKLLIRRFI